MILYFTSAGNSLYAAKQLDEPYQYSAGKKRYDF